MNVEGILINMLQYVRLRCLIVHPGAYVCRYFESSAAVEVDENDEWRTTTNQKQMNERKTAVERENRRDAKNRTRWEENKKGSSKYRAQSRWDDGVKQRRCDVRRDAVSYGRAVWDEDTTINNTEKKKKANGDQGGGEMTRRQNIMVNDNKHSVPFTRKESCVHGSSRPNFVCFEDFFTALNARWTCQYRYVLLPA